MAVLALTLQPSKILRTPTLALDLEDVQSYQTLGRDMVDTMLHSQGIGLAAPQIGHKVSLFIIHKDIAGTPDHLILCNPKISFQSKACQAMEEGCLSCPTIFGQVRRPEKIRVMAYTLDGQRHNYKAKGMLAKVFQHEIDHLKGVLIIDKFE